MNQKTGKRAVLFTPRLHTASPWFLFRYDSDPPERIASPPESRSTWPAVYPHLTLAAREFIEEGVEQTRRHKCCYASARSLEEAGCPQEVAAGWLHQGAEKCDPPLPGEEVDRIVKQVYQLEQVGRAGPERRVG